MTEVLAARILEHINGEPLASGTHLTAQELADRFNVSRSPVNRALRLLHAKGVLAHEQNRGYFVAVRRQQRRLRSWGSAPRTS